MKSLERVFTVFLSPFEGTPEEWRDRMIWLEVNEEHDERLRRAEECWW